MADYSITITRSAAKELSKLPLEAIEQIQLAVNVLASNPRPSNCKKLKGFKNLYRIRSGDYRIVYSIEDHLLTIEVVRIGNRKDIYS